MIRRRTAVGVFPYLSWYDIVDDSQDCHFVEAWELIFVTLLYLQFFDPFV